MPKKFVVQAQWDEEAKVWVATSEDLIGLVVEAPGLDSLLAKINEVTPDLVEGNAIDLRPDDVLELSVHAPVPHAGMAA